MVQDGTQIGIGWSVCVFNLLPRQYLGGLSRNEPRSSRPETLTRRQASLFLDGPRFPPRPLHRLRLTGIGARL